VEIGLKDVEIDNQRNQKNGGKKGQEFPANRSLLPPLDACHEITVG
jgi:hypothetical protein